MIKKNKSTLIITTLVMLIPMIAGKLVGGISAVAVALWLTRKYED